MLFKIINLLFFFLPIQDVIDVPVIIKDDRKNIHL